MRTFLSWVMGLWFGGGNGEAANLGSGVDPGGASLDEGDRGVGIDPDG